MTTVEKAEETCVKDCPDVPTCRGGTSFDRVDYPPDCLVDNWHPLEKAAYPKYFAKRELGKMEYVERWQKKYGGKPLPPDVETS